MPDLEEVQVAGRVLHFQTTQPSGRLTLAVVYAGSNAQSRGEAASLVALLGTGLAVGDLVLCPLLVEQSELAAGPGYGAVFSTSGVDPELLGAALKQRHVPCLTGHLEQVASGSCTVAIRSIPSVGIVLNAVNAATAGVHFATAFRMMVEEL